MAMKFSTGLKDGVLGVGSLKSLLDDGIIKVYSGPVPADADAALGAAVLLNTYTDDGAAVGTGNGLMLAAAAVGGAISKEPTQVWKGTAPGSGSANATFFRFVQQADDGSAAIDQPRVQGVVGGAGADMFVVSTVFNGGTAYYIDYFSITVPNL